jgi:hypothetical protein
MEMLPISVSTLPVFKLTGPPEMLAVAPRLPETDVPEGVAGPEVEAVARLTVVAAAASWPRRACEEVAVWVTVVPLLTVEVGVLVDVAIELPGV